MPVTPTYPGVYVQEVPSGVRTIVGAPTSVGLFIGMANGGPVNKPVLCLNNTEFNEKFPGSAATNLGRYIRLFFMNGGTSTHVMRIAQNAARAAVTLRNEANTADALTLTAKNYGKLGDTVRARVSYSGVRPESTFNIDLFRWDVTPTGARLQAEAETFTNLTMNPTASNYAVDVITQNSKLVSATAPAPTAAAGYSQAMRPIIPAPATAAGFRTAVMAEFTGEIQISVGGSKFVNIDLLTFATTLPAATGSFNDYRNNTLPGLVDAYINGILVGNGVSKTIAASFADGPATNAYYLRIAAGTAGEEVVVQRGLGTDAAASLLFGIDQGGFEVGAYADARPAPTGVVFRATNAGSMDTFGTAAQNTIQEITLTASGVPRVTDLTGAYTLATTSGTDAMYVSSGPGVDGIREKLRIIAAAVNDAATADPDAVPWRAELWGDYRLAFVPTVGDDNLSTAVKTSNVPGSATATTGTNLAAQFVPNVRFYSLGVTGTGPRQGAGVAGYDGTAPTDVEYTEAYKVADTDIDIFNLMVLPPDATVAMENIYPEASVFCRKRRAFLVMDPPTTWRGVKQKVDVIPLRIGLEKDHSAIYYPRLVTRESGRDVIVGPSGAIAGLYSRIDGTRGVWKAAAGTVDGTLRGVRGVEQLFTDDQNGVMNPRAVNIIRAFPEGIITWGARTMDGDDDFGSEYKYIPIRRLALFIEETLYRNLKWVVFEPNDDPLYAQIRLNVGAFMQDLFRKGAFEGATPKAAYFVRCDRETTTNTDRALGIVNIWVGFAPLKPAEFVIIYLQQKTAQAEV